MIFFWLVWTSVAFLNIKMKIKWKHWRNPQTKKDRTIKGIGGFQWCLYFTVKWMGVRLHKEDTGNMMQVQSHLFYFFFLQWEHDIGSEVFIIFDTWVGASNTDWKPFFSFFVCLFVGLPKYFSIHFRKKNIRKSSFFFTYCFANSETIDLLYVGSASKHPFMLSLIRHWSLLFVRRKISPKIATH